MPKYKCYRPLDPISACTVSYSAQFQLPSPSSDRDTAAVSTQTSIKSSKEKHRMQKKITSEFWQFPYEILAMCQVFMSMHERHLHDFGSTSLPVLVLKITRINTKPIDLRNPRS